MTTQSIWDLYADDVKRFILSKVQDVFVTEDLLQDTFIKIHTKKDSLKDASKLKAWVFSVARYTVLDYFRKHKLVASDNDTEVVYLEDTSEHTEADCLHGILKSLPKKYKLPLYLSDIKGLKQQEVAAQLDLPLA